jgi:hypothetical protein
MGAGAFDDTARQRRREQGGHNGGLEKVFHGGSFLAICTG